MPEEISLFRFLSFFLSPSLSLFLSGLDGMFKRVLVWKLLGVNRIKRMNRVIYLSGIENLGS